MLEGDIGFFREFVGQSKCLSKSNVTVVVCALTTVLSCGRLGFDSIQDDDIPDSGAITTGLVAWYPFDIVNEDGSPDVAGGQNATCDPGCPTPSTGIIGGGAMFVDQRLAVADDGRFSMTSGFTVMGWGRPNSFGNTQCIVTQPYGSGSSVANVWALCLASSGLPYFFGGGTNRLDAIVPAQVDEWIHLSAIWSDPTLSFYVDAQEIASAEMVIDFDNLDVRIGGDQDKDGPKAAWHGVLDDIRIYNRALSVQELEGLANP